jgi:hypothetical protein
MFVSIRNPELLCTNLARSFSPSTALVGWNSACFYMLVTAVMSSGSMDLFFADWAAVPPSPPLRVQPGHE